MSRTSMMFASAILALMLLMSSTSAVYEIWKSVCNDGTGYYQCSTEHPGFACLPDANSPNGVSLINDIKDKIVKTTDGTNQHKCACENFEGYIEKNGECVKTTCDYNGQTFKDGECTGDDPKRCASGEIVNDAAHCGCPVGKTPANDGKTCTLASGCRWDNPPCAPNEECKFVESNEKDEGHCVLKQGCAATIGTVKCTSMQYCDTASNPDGVCKTKEGCKYSNPACTGEKICDQSTNKCVDADKIGGVNAITPSTPTAGAIPSDLSCCCAPALGIVGLAGLAVFRRRD